MWGYGGVGLWFEEYIIFDNIIGGRFWWKGFEEYILMLFWGRFWWKGFEEYILMLFWGRFWWKGFEEYILMLFLCGEFVSGNSCGGMGEGFGGDFVWGDFMHSRPYPLERRLAFGRVFGGDVGGGVCGRIWRR